MADLGVLWAVNSASTPGTFSMGSSYITTNILNADLVNKGAPDTTTVWEAEPSVIKGERIVSLIIPLKPNPFAYESIESKDAYSIELIVPGPIANISYGIRIGRDLERIEVPRVYPPIYINPRSRNA